MTSMRRRNPRTGAKAVKPPAKAAKRLGVMVIGMFLCPVTLGHFGGKDYDERHTRTLLPSLLPRGWNPHMIVSGDATTAPG
jgi:hypothetical protein